MMNNQNLLHIAQAWWVVVYRRVKQMSFQVILREWISLKGCFKLKYFERK